jgi:hypothetical protein
MIQLDKKIYIKIFLLFFYELIMDFILFFCQSLSLKENFKSN